MDEAKKFRDRLLGKKLRGELNSTAEKITCGQLLDDVLRHVQENGKTSTAKIWQFVIEANLRPFFGDLKGATVSTNRLREYRDKRKADGRSEATCNRELSLLRTAFNLGRKSAPPKVDRLPYFPLVSEAGNARQGFLTDEQYATLRDALPDYLKPLFVTAYFTGVRRGELLACSRGSSISSRGLCRSMLMKRRTAMRESCRSWPATCATGWNGRRSNRTDAHGCSIIMGRRSGIFAGRGTKPAKARAFPISSFMISGALPFATCAGPESPRSSACASPAIEPIRWSAATTLWMWKTSERRRN
jgi:hypothetical protein